MSRRTLAALALALGLLGALWPAAAAAVPAPAWSLTVTPMPANFIPGTVAEYLVVATNVGAAPSGPAAVQVKASLPEGLQVSDVDGFNNDPDSPNDPTCTAPAQEISCETTEAVHPGRWLLIQIKAEVTAPEGSTLETQTSISGGGATGEAKTTIPTLVAAAPPPFGFLPGSSALASNEDGSAAVLAGSHPYQQSLYFGFPTEVASSSLLSNAGHPRDIRLELPRGLIGNLAASADLCTEIELTGKAGCPEASQVGLLHATTLVSGKGGASVITSNLYNMVPPPGAVAVLGTDAANVGIYLHAIAALRTDGDYGAEAVVRDTLAFGTNPIFNVQTEIWGDPSAKAHDATRGECQFPKGGECPAGEPQKTAFWTLPGDCPHKALRFQTFADSWEEPSPPFGERETQYEGTDLTGAPAPLVDCGSLAFEPTVKAAPTTNLTDSPSGLDFALHQPQETNLFEGGDPSLPARFTAALKDTAITFPAGMVINASQAGGLGACSEAQIGFLGTEAGQLHFSRAPQGCPAAAKLGTVRATSPLLPQRNEEHEVLRDGAGEPLPEALGGSVYLAQPFANPFGSLAAVYLAIEDEQTGIVAKLAGEAELDPATGQVSARFKEAPELPIEDIEAHLFAGSRGAFVTPPSCGAHTTATQLTPWSAPEGKDAFPAASFETTAAPGGGACPATEAQMPHAPTLSAGTLSAAAGKYSPLTFRLARPDGTQRWQRIEASLPVGLSAKLAGIASCSEAAIAKARSREAPERGRLEQADPSCPAASEIATMSAAAGAGPDPYYTQGHVYLAGPYKGAPLSAVAIAPAVAGPFDLGAVVVRSALFLDPATAQARIVTDPLPTILDGVPVDLRSVEIDASRPAFTLNPTSCAVKSFGGQIVSTLGQAAPLFERFQVGGCKSLPYKPKLDVRLFGPTNRGAHPRLKAVFTAKPGEANTARVSFTFPKSEFIDQGHFRTICTRVQFAASQCPPGSVYGQVRAFTPLLDYPLEGPIYLRSSNHQLPDAVVALRGPASQPLAVDAVGRVDSVNGGLRVRFEALPDAPLSKLVVTTQGAKKGLFQNSTNICKGTHRATLKLDAQSGKVSDTQPEMKAQCGKGKGGKGR